MTEINKAKEKNQAETISKLNVKNLNSFKNHKKAIFQRVIKYGVKQCKL